jgi:hypothetical protein
MAIKSLNLSHDQKLAQSLEDKQVHIKSKPAQNLPPAVNDATKTELGKADNQPISQPVGQSTNRSIDQSTNQSTDQSINQLTGSVVERPVAFYVPKIIDKKIDEAVIYYQENHKKKIDRSAVVSALLGDPDIWTHEALDKLADKVVNQLTNRLTSRLIG